MEHREEVAKMLEGVRGVVEASRFEYHTLWCTYSKRGQEAINKTDTIISYDWQESGSGLGVTVGHIAKLPVCISLHVDIIEGHKILFYEATSRAVDWTMIEKWLEKNLSDSAKRRDGVYLNKSDASNFVNVIWEIRDKDKKNEIAA